jgi:ribosome-associated translation inhibitor RaiA
MQQPLQIQFRGMSPSAALETATREKVAKLEQFAPSLTACRVVIELEQKHQQQGRPISVHVEASMPGHQLSVDRASAEDAYIALRDAFAAMTRRLEDAGRRNRRT